MAKTTSLVLLTLAFLFVVSTVKAEGIGGQSALLVQRLQSENSASIEAKRTDFMIKKKVVRKVLERYNSVLADSTDAFIDTCQKYDLDCYLLPSIAGVESYFGKYYMPGTYNPFGWGRGLIYFQSWGDGIDQVGKGLRENYINKGATTIEEIGPIYCEGNTWAGKVRAFHNAFVQEEAKHGLYFPKNAVEL